MFWSSVDEYTSLLEYDRRFGEGRINLRNLDSPRSDCLDPENVDSKLQNVDNYLPIHTAPFSRSLISIVRIII